MEQDKTSCVVRNLTDEININMQEMRQKIINLIKTEFLLVRNYLVCGEKEKYAEVRQIRDNCWKFRNLAYIQVKNNLFFRGYSEYFIIHYYEYISSFVSWMVRSFDQSSLKQVSPEFLILYDAIMDFFANQSIIKKKRDESYLSNLREKRLRLLRDCEDYALNGGDDRFLVVYLSMIIQGVHHSNSYIV